MKRNLKTATILISTLLFCLLMIQPQARAGDKEWSTVGKILTGIIGAQILYETINTDYSYTSPFNTPYRQYHNRRPNIIIETTRTYDIENPQVCEHPRYRYRRPHRNHRRNRNHTRERRSYRYRTYQHTNYEDEDGYYEYETYEQILYTPKQYCEMY